MPLRGVNLGGWLMMEGYILGGPNVAENQIKRKFKKLYGKKGLKLFERSFRDNFIQEDDFKNIAAMGANTVRLPFNCRLVEKRPAEYSPKGLAYLDKALAWAKKYNLGVILDLHAAPGAQNCDWHSDSSGRAMLWENKNLRRRTVDIWEQLVDRYKDDPALIGYDLLNEPVLEDKDPTVLKEFYGQCIERVRAVDKKHLIFIEGDVWATRIDFLKDLLSESVTVSIHAYWPLYYTF